MSYCSVCGLNHEGTGCPSPTKLGTIYPNMNDLNQSVDNISLKLDKIINLLMQILQGVRK